MTMTISIVVATYGSLEWEQLAHERAMPSAHAQEPDSVVAVHLHEGTLAEARNLGAQDASGEWLCFLDADDELAPGYLAAMRRRLADEDDFQLEGWPAGFLRRSGASILAPALQYVEKYGRVLPPALPNRGQPMDALNHCVIGTLVPRDLFLEVGGFRDDLPIYEDWALFLACVRAGSTIVDVPDAVYRAHMRDESRNRPRDATQATAAYTRIRTEHLDAVARGAVFI